MTEPNKIDVMQFLEDLQTSMAEHVAARAAPLRVSQRTADELRDAVHHELPAAYTSEFERAILVNSAIIALAVIDIREILLRGSR